MNRPSCVTQEAVELILDDRQAGLQCSLSKMRNILKVRIMFLSI